jgi:hypothetical protein
MGCRAAEDEDLLPSASGACVAPDGTGSPETIEEVVDLVNLLPCPVTVECLVQALDRPLAVNSTMGTLSAQPAVDEQNPRIFLFFEGLVLSIVPAGRGRDLLELRQYFESDISLKGELRMPLETPISDSEPYGHLRYSDQITACGLCHLGEQLVPEIGHPNAYASVAYRPVDDELVPLDAVRAEHEACDPDLEPDRCALFSALFDHGEVVHEDFPSDLPTIYD